MTTLGGSSATVNGMPAPMFYSTNGQIGIIEPAAPGIFTANQQGTGIAAILQAE